MLPGHPWEAGFDVLHQQLENGVTNTERPLVTLALFAYNQERFVGEAIYSRVGAGLFALGDNSVGRLLDR